MPFEQRPERSEDVSAAKPWKNSMSEGIKSSHKGPRARTRFADLEEANVVRLKKTKNYKEVRIGIQTVVRSQRTFKVHLGMILKSIGFYSEHPKIPQWFSGRSNIC